MTYSAELSRRSLLGASAAGLALPGYLLPAGTAFAQSGKPPLEFNVSTSSFSVAERDRRWAAVRAGMAKPHWNLDAIITVGSDGAGNAARYLTQIGNRPGGEGSPEVVFPRDGAQPVYAQVGQARARDRRKAANPNWTADGKLEIAAEDGPEALAKVIAARGINRAGARVGIAALSGSRFNENGSVSTTYLDKLKVALPGVVFVGIDQWGPDSGPIEESAMLKGAEEHAVIRRIIAAAEQGLMAMVAAGKTAKQQADIWFAAYTTMFALTGEDPSRLSIALDNPGNTTLGEPTNDPVKMGQIATEEIESSIQGYRAQINHSVFFGGPSTPGYDYYRACIELAAKLLQEAPSWVVPGKTTCGEFVKRYTDRLEELGGDDTSGVSLHSSGIGNLTRPRVGLKNSVKDHAIVIRPGMAFDFKPAFHLKREKMADAGGKNRDVQLGEHFLVTEQSMVRLGSRPLVPLTTQG